MGKPTIEINSLSKKYLLGQRESYYSLRDVMAGLVKLKKGHNDKSEFWALKDINFHINQGDAIGIIGRNGAGKSTLLKILSRITPPTKGSVTLRGRVASLLEVGTGFHSELTGRENIFLNGAILGMKQNEIKRDFDKIVDFAEIGKFLDTPVKRYSSGMYVRLAFAVAAHLEPEILIVDEVLAVGDAQFQKKCLGRMESIGKEGRTVLFVSHNMSSVQSLCKIGIWLDKGQIVKTGDMNSVVTDYIENTVNNPTLSFGHSDNQMIEIRNVTLSNGRGQMTDFHPGDNLDIEINYRAKEKITRPSFWIAVNSHYGPMFIASMLYDGFCPKMLQGEGKIKCSFQNMPLLPGLYSVQMGIRSQTSFEDIVPTKDIGFFNIIGDMSALGFKGDNAEQILTGSTQLIIPYRWVLPNGDDKQFMINSSPTDIPGKK